MEICSEWDVQKKETRFTGMQKVKKILSQHSQGSLVWLKQMPQEMGGGSSPCGGERSEKAPWRGNLRSPGIAWELEGTEEGS